jgi:APA family basic amino acid/polyamine antiporter
MNGANPDAGFTKGLGLFDATMLVAGSMIGSGVFLVSRDIVRDVGGSGWLLAVWAVTGVMTVLGALAYGELAAMMPHAGGQYVFLREAYGSLWGFLYGWTSFLVIQTGTIAAVGVAFANFLGVLVPALGTGKDALVLFRAEHLDWVVAVRLPWSTEPVKFFERQDFTITAGHLVAVFIVIGLSFWNCLGIRQGKLLQNVFTVAKVGALVALIVIGFTVAVDPRAVEFNREHVWDGLTESKSFVEAFRIVPVAGLAAAMVFSGAMVGSLFSADAWNNVTFIAGEVRGPERNLPRALALGTGGVVLLYFLANVVYLAALPVRSVNDLGDPKETVFRAGIENAENQRVGTALIEKVWPEGGAGLMAIAIMISTFGCANGLILSGARLLYAMARDRLFFRPAGTLNARHVPAFALLLQMVWTVLLVFSGSYSELLDYVIFAALLFYVLTVSALFVLRIRHPDWPRPYRAIGYPLLPLAYLLAAAFIMLSLLVVRPVYSWPSFLIILSGVPVYFLWRAVAPMPRTDDEHVTRLR